jgi:hypothetical protein
MNSDNMPATIVITERPVIQIILKCGKVISVSVILFIKCKTRMPHVQQRKLIYNHANRVASIIIF